MTKSITLLGSTGSIGTQALEVLAGMPERYQVVGLAAGKNLECLAEQIREFRPRRVSIQRAEDIETLRSLVPDFSGEILWGDEGLSELSGASDTQVVLVGLVGLTGLQPTLTALEAGKQVLTANKETFVAGGHLVAPYLKQIIPIDSEHSAIHQCLKHESRQAIRTLYLTASGGPFRNHPLEALSQVTLQEALNHPNWVMGSKITIDSATMMNKGLEVIEAHWLFGVSYEKIQVVIHPQSIIHSGVEFMDGSILVQMGAPDMRVPIQYALTYPERVSAVGSDSFLNLLQLGQLDIHPPDTQRFPCIQLAYEAGKLGSGATTVLNAADEVAVSLFLQEKIGYLDIPRLIESVLEESRTAPPQPSLQEVFDWDAWTRAKVLEISGIQQESLVAG